MAGDLIVLYDVLGTASPDKAWSPNVWKIRYVLNYKQLAYRTEWIETCDIAALAQRVGAPPTARKRDGTPIYTVPFIFCPHCAAYISNSVDVALHLERAFPSAPRVFAAGQTDEPLVRAWDDRWNEAVGHRHMMPLMIAPNYAQLPPRSAAHFRRTRESIFKLPLEQQAPPEKLPTLWGAFYAGLARIAGYIPDDRTFVAGGPTPTFPDFIMAGWLVWLKRLYGPDSREWHAVEELNGARWRRLMQAFEAWEYTEDSPKAKSRL